MTAVQVVVVVAPSDPAGLQQMVDEGASFGRMLQEPAAKEAFRKAVRIAHEAGNKVALTLSDAFCVDRETMAAGYTMSGACSPVTVNTVLNRSLQDSVRVALTPQGRRLAEEFYAETCRRAQ